MSTDIIPNLPTPNPALTGNELMEAVQAARPIRVTLAQIAAFAPITPPSSDVIFPSSATFPVAPVVGQVFMNTTTQQAYIYWFDNQWHEFVVG